MGLTSFTLFKDKKMAMFFILRSSAKARSPVTKTSAFAASAHATIHSSAVSFMPSGTGFAAARASGKLRRAAHKAIAGVSADIEAFHFNKAVARLYELATPPGAAMFGFTNTAATLGAAARPTMDLSGPWLEDEAAAGAMAACAAR